MMSFRRKILWINLILLAVLIAALFPLIGWTVNHILRLSLTHRGEALIAQLKTAPDREAMVERVKGYPEFAFQPVILLDGKGKAIDGTATLPEKEIEEAMQHGRGFSEHHSLLFHQKAYFLALSFTAHDEPYILQMQFRGDEIDQIKFYFKIGILVVCTLFLLLSSALDTMTVHYILRPIQQIIEVISPYKEGKEELLPRIVLSETMRGGEFTKLASTLNSLTERIQKQIENLTRQREETEEILESIGEGIIAADTSAKVTFVNRTACRMLELSKEQMLKQTLSGMKTPSAELAKKCHELILDALQTSEPIVHTFTLRNKDPLYLDLIAAPLAHQNGALLVLQDKTSDYRIVELGKDFIANASHELRTPITIIRGFAETLQDLPELSQEMLKEITEKIVRTCMRLDKLVRSLLTLSDIENLSQERFKPADLVLLMENCKHHLLTANPNVQITTQSEMEAAPIIADADLLELAILNLLENAVKYSPSPARIEMDLQKEGEEVYLKIQDKGIGISHTDLVHIFDRFYTVDKARSRKSGGAGLGLSIVKTIVEKHRGKVKVTSELHKGSTFTLILPLTS